MNESDNAAFAPHERKSVRVTSAAELGTHDAVQGAVRPIIFFENIQHGLCGEDTPQCLILSIERDSHHPVPLLEAPT